MSLITISLWFEHQALEAAQFYCSLFAPAKLLEVQHFSPTASQVSGQPEGSVMCVSFEIKGQKFFALNGGPLFTLTPAISLMVECQDQKEVDHLWKALGEQGHEMDCGWITDRFGVTWQIVPQGFNELLAHPDPMKREKAWAAMLKMKKLDLKALQAAMD